MIELSRKNIRAVRTTIRQSLGITARRAPCITLRTTDNQLQIQAAGDTVAIELRLPGNAQPECFAIPYEALTACEGRQNDPVSFTRHDNTVVVQWADKGIPQLATFPVTEPAEMPCTPDTFASIEPRFLAPMANAVATTDNQESRFALNCVRLRGSDGQIAATDSSQALIETGYSFPWQDEVLVFASGAFASNDFSGADEVLIGRSEDWVSIQANSRTLHLKIDKERRFPSIDLQIPTRGSAATTLALSEDDVEFLLTSTRRLPGASEPNSPVTVDLNGVVAIRAAAADLANSTELVLSNSRRVGDEVRFSTNREFLNRAAELGFREIYLRNAEAPVYCQDDRRTYIWALLSEEDSVKGSSQTIRISSPVSSSTHTPKPRTHSVMTTSQPTTARTATAPPAAAANNEPDPTPTLLNQAEALRDSLSSALSDTRDLIASLKRHQKQNRLVETTLRSLKQLEHIGA
ncbi:MAG TPA: hypothetical protein PLY87_22400 [Planctomycetaceae bacterium]|nr:hypothetical protein [Planctomycetaceae bacterium]